MYTIYPRMFVFILIKNWLPYVTLSKHHSNIINQNIQIQQIKTTINNSKTFEK